MKQKKHFPDNFGNLPIVKHITNMNTYMYYCCIVLKAFLLLGYNISLCLPQLCIIPSLFLSNAYAYIRTVYAPVEKYKACCLAYIISNHLSSNFVVICIRLDITRLNQQSPLLSFHHNFET